MLSSNNHVHPDGQRLPLAGEPGNGHCVEDDRGYSHRYLSFVKAHWEAFEAAYYAPSPHTARNELSRLQREYQTLPPRHICTCARMNPRTGITEHHCLECRRVSQQLNEEQLPPEIGRSGVPGPRVPLLVVLDLRAGYAA